MVKRKTSETELLENKRNKYFESMYLKFHGGKVEDITKRGSPFSADANIQKVFKMYKRNVGKKARFTHNHPTYRFLSYSTGPVPSETDFKTFLKNNLVETMAVAQNNPFTGKVEGYFIAMKTDETPKKIVWNPIKSSLLLFPSAIFGVGTKNYLDYFSEKYNLKYRFVPAKGYELNKAGNAFKPVRKKDLESISKSTLSVLAVASFLLSFYFSFSQITGFSILNSNLSSSGLIGILFFVVGLVVTFFYLKKK